MQRYLTSEAGAKGFQLFLREKGYKHVMNPIEVPLNNAKFHYVINCENEDGVKLKFYCLFKHDFFYTFPQKYSKFFDKYPNLNSAGESINFDRLIYALNNDCRLIFIYESGFFYEIEPIEILNVHQLAKEFYENGFIREQDKINNYIDNGSRVEFRERTISFPVKALARLMNG